jgi:hypothetical protein
MLGLNSLTKLFRRTIGPRMESLGILPHRYYLSRALDALEEDDIDEAVRMVLLAAGDNRQSSRWRLICQQVIFRCRVLGSIHERRIKEIQAELEIFRKHEKICERYSRLQEAEIRARDILKDYESNLLSQLAGPNPNNARPS